jgi:hypothetical protein
VPATGCVPAYLVLFAGGRFYALGHRLSLRGLFRLTGVALAAAVVAELLTSGGFYAFSGRFAEPTLAGFIPRFEQYFPRSLGSFALYLGMAAVMHAAVAAVFRRDAGLRTLMGTISER